MKNEKIVKLASIAVALILAFSLAAMARPGRGRGPEGTRVARPGMGRTLHSRGVLGKLIFPCPAACGDAAKACTESADSDALECVASDCPSEITAAQDACAEDRRSDGCGDAVEALVDCAGTCLDTRADEIDLCRDEVVECRDACEAEE